MYVRRGVNCELVAQPGHVNETDVYGNTFENWCVDATCAPQDPDGLKAKFIFNTFTNGVRVPSQYINSPLIPGTTVDVAVRLADVAILGLEEDRDLVLYNESNTLSLQLEDGTSVVSGTVFS